MIRLVETDGAMITATPVTMMTSEMVTAHTSARSATIVINVLRSRSIPALSSAV